MMEEEETKSSSKNRLGQVRRLKMLCRGSNPGRFSFELSNKPTTPKEVVQKREKEQHSFKSRVNARVAKISNAEYFEILILARESRDSKILCYVFRGFQSILP